MTRCAIGKTAALAGPVTGIASRAHIIDPIGGPLKYLILAVQGMLVILMMTKIATSKYLFD